MLNAAKELPTQQTPVSLAIRAACDRTLAKYDISEADADFAATTLAAFFDAKGRNPKALLILPQIADWGWHELIADTRGYDRFCQELSDSAKSSSAIKHTNIRQPHLEHVVIEDDTIEHTNYDHVTVDDRNHEHVTLRPDMTLKHVTMEPNAQQKIEPERAFQKTVAFFKDRYGIDFEAYGWIDAGWASPSYRLRDPRFAALKQFRLEPAGRKELDELEQKLAPSIATLDLDWIPERLTRRYPISEDGAALAFTLYKAYLDWRLAHREAACVLPAIASWAAFEHVLWTEKYRTASIAAYGEFLHFDGAAPWVDEGDPSRLFDGMTLPESYGFVSLNAAATAAGWVLL